MESNKTLDELEMRMRRTLATALGKATSGDPAWRRFEPTLMQGQANAETTQKGTSSSPEADAPRGSEA